MLVFLALHYLCSDFGTNKTTYISMTNKLIGTFLCILTAFSASAQTSFELTVSNPSKAPRQNAPVVYQLNGETRSALVTLDGKEIPCQLDDINGDGRYDELCFLTHIGKREKQTFHVTLFTEGAPRTYDSQVYVEMMLTNKKIKESNKQDLYISELKVDRGVNPYWMIHHHGAAFESDMVAYRIYFDHRQTVDIYGKYNKGFELRQTQFYPDAKQKASGLSKTDYLMQAIRRSEVRVYSIEESIAPILHELRKIGTNLNQLAYFSNIGHVDRVQAEIGLIRSDNEEIMQKLSDFLQHPEFTVRESR